MPLDVSEPSRNSLPSVSHENSVVRHLSVRLSSQSQIVTSTGGSKNKSQQISSSLPSNGLLNYASPSTLFFTAPGISPPGLSGFLHRSNRGGDTNAEAAHGDALWNDLSLRVLPLFNGEGLRGAIEDLNDLVRQAMRGMPMPQLLEKLGDLMQRGTQIFNGKLTGLTDEKLSARLIEIWSFFFGTVLPYFQGVFLPLEMELKVLIPDLNSDVSVRTILLASYRNYVIIPCVDRIMEGFENTITVTDVARRAPDTVPRMHQMLTVLSEIKDDNQTVLLQALHRLKDDIKKSDAQPAHLSRAE